MRTKPTAVIPAFALVLAACAEAPARGDDPLADDSDR
jgi:hypothetical protein